MNCLFRKNRTLRKAKCRAFTLLELLVALVILGLIASVVGPRVMKHVGTSKTRTAALQVEELGTALETYRLELDGYPRTEEGLAALVARPPGGARWNGPYLRKPVVPKDPWGREYRYRHPGEHGAYDLYSLGADDREGGEGENADVVSWR
jgi:general secretion pathway protein G